MTKSKPVWLSAEGLECGDCEKVAQRAMEIRGTWLTSEAHRVLVHVGATGKPVKVSPGAAKQLA